MSDQPVKRGRGRPRKHPRPDDAPRRVFPEPASLAEAETGAPITDEEFFDQAFAKPATGKRMNILSPDDATLSALFRLGRLFCTQEEAAAFLGVHYRTLQNFLYRCEEAMNAWQDGLQNAKISLRRKQLQLADKNAPMGIFLGKNYLGQRDENHTTMTVNKPANELSQEALEELAKRGLPGLETPAPDAKKMH